jgi:aspartyl-tRNA(Asn)/glutamyl-tRNA(Gln) amidotransferase subunit C
MAVTENDVRHVAALARVGLPAARVPELVAELNRILDHMDVLSQVDTAAVQPVAGVAAGGAPLRVDGGPQIALARSRDAFVPQTRDGFILVPRLATHEEAPASAADAADLRDAGGAGGGVPS